MNWLWDILWAVSALAVGIFISSVCASTILITFRCSLKILKKAKRYTDLWDAAACRIEFIALIITHLLFILVASGLIFWLCPSIALYGYLFGFGLCIIIGWSKCGTTVYNVSDTLRVISKYTTEENLDLIMRRLEKEEY